MKCKNRLDLEELDARVVPSTTALTESSQLPTMTIGSTSFLDAATGLQTTGIATDLGNAISSSTGRATSVVVTSPIATDLGNAISSSTGLATTAATNVISTDLANAITSSAETGATALIKAASQSSTTTTSTTTSSTTTAATTTTSTTSATTTAATGKSTTTKTATQAVGTGSGTFTNPINQADLTVDDMTTYTLKGTATLAGMGAVNVGGTLHSVGWVLSGQATGELTFSNGKGYVTIQVTGPTQAGFSALPEKFSYTVVAHSGSYTLPKTGTLTLVVPATTSGYVSQGQGTFQLAI